MIKYNKKIFIISQPEVTNTVGGAISVFTEMCNLLHHNNYDIFAICRNKKNGKPKSLENGLNFINLYYEYPYTSYSAAINKLIKREKPDLLIFFFVELYVDANLSQEFDNIPRILMFHSRPDFYFSINPKIEQKLEKIYKNTTSQILFDSFYYLLPRFIQNGQVISIPNSKTIPKETINNKIENKKIIYLSRIDCCKGLEFLINSFKEIAKKYPDWCIDIYGQSTPPNYQNNLIKLTKKLNIEKQINFMGITNNVIETLLQYDFCVFPSYFEGFGIGLLEAQSVGLPAICLKKCSGANELVIDKKNGFLAEENYSDFAQKMEILIKNKGLRSKFSKSAKENSLKYDKCIVDKIWLEEIEKIISKTQPSSKYIKNVKKSYPIFPIEKIIQMAQQQKTTKWYQKIFSIKNKYVNNEKIKVLKIFNIDIEFRTAKKFDLVYLWVDSNDKEWKEKKKLALTAEGKFFNFTNEATNECRFTNNDELKYSLRSVEKYASWINHIYIITDNQTPDWLNTNNHKISIINQNHILPNNSKYCFNSCAIEHCIKNIPYLSEYFLLANDDMFFNKKTKPSFFFTKTGKIIYRHFGFLGRMGNDLYANQLINASNIIEKRYKEAFLLYPHHNIDGYKKSIVNACYNEFKNEIDETISHPFRTSKDIQRTIYSNYASATGNAILKEVEPTESLYMTVRTVDKINELKKHKPHLFCINDTELCTDKDRQETKKFLEEYFPEKSQFEK